jgi:uncharacterized protein YkwD
MMNRKDTVIRLLLILAVLGSLVSCASTPRRDTTQRPRPRLSLTLLEKRIHTLINKERAKEGLSSLQWDDSLANIARKHSRDMAKRNFFDHVSPDGHDMMHRYGQDGYTCSVRVGSTFYTGAENILQNNLYDSVRTVNGVASYDWNSLDKIAETTVQGWMKSPGHRRNILTPHWGREGIGVVIAPDDKVYITQNFC